MAPLSTSRIRNRHLSLSLCLLVLLHTLHGLWRLPGRLLRCSYSVTKSDDFIQNHFSHLTHILYDFEVEIKSGGARRLI